MSRRPPRSTRTDTLFPYTPLFRSAACTLCLAAVGLSPAAVLAQDYPSRPVKLIVPFGPGTTTDIISRVIGEALAKPLGQAVIVENRAGAGGAIGSDLVAKSPADGYTLVMGTVGKIGRAHV